MDFILYSPLTTFFFRFFPMPLIAFSLCGRKRFCLLLYLMRFSLLSGAGFLVHIISTSPKRDRSKLFEMGSRGLCFSVGWCEGEDLCTCWRHLFGVYSNPESFCLESVREMREKCFSSSSAPCEYKRKSFSYHPPLMPPTRTTPPGCAAPLLPLFKQKYVPSNDFHLHLHNNCGCVEVFLENSF
jgi:hypothetical protein